MERKEGFMQISPRVKLILALLNHVRGLLRRRREEWTHATNPRLHFCERVERVAPHIANVKFSPSPCQVRLTASQLILTSCLHSIVLARFSLTL